jgi:hypothetical protein
VEKISQEIILAAVALGNRVGYVLIASADRKGRPHLAAADRIEAASAGRIAVSSWFCPRTAANLQENPGVAVVAWDAAAGSGHQVLGRVESVQDLRILDGYAPGQEAPDFPQTERRLVIAVEKVTAFGRMAHSDQEE